MNPRARSRTPFSIGSNQLSKSCAAVSVAGSKESVVVVTFVMAWSPSGAPTPDDSWLNTETTPTEFQPLPLRHPDLTEKILDIKRENSWSWKHICREIGGYSDTLIVGALLGQM